MSKLRRWVENTRPVLWFRNKLQRWSAPELYDACQSLIDQNEALMHAILKVNVLVGVGQQELNSNTKNSNHVIKAMLLLNSGIASLSPEIIEAAKDPLLAFDTKEKDGTIIFTLVQNSPETEEKELE